MRHWGRNASSTAPSRRWRPTCPPGRAAPTGARRARRRRDAPTRPEGARGVDARQAHAATGRSDHRRGTRRAQRQHQAKAPPNKAHLRPTGTRHARARRRRRRRDAAKATPRRRAARRRPKAAPTLRDDSAAPERSPPRRNHIKVGSGAQGADQHRPRVIWSARLRAPATESADLYKERWDIELSKWVKQNSAAALIGAAQCSQ